MMRPIFPAAKLPHFPSCYCAWLLLYIIHIPLRFKFPFSVQWKIQIQHSHTKPSHFAKVHNTNTWQIWACFVIHKKIIERFRFHDGAMVPLSGIGSLPLRPIAAYSLLRKLLLAGRSPPLGR